MKIQIVTTVKKLFQWKMNIKNVILTEDKNTKIFEYKVKLQTN